MTSYEIIQKLNAVLRLLNSDTLPFEIFRNTEENYQSLFNNIDTLYTVTSPQAVSSALNTMRKEIKNTIEYLKGFNVGEIFVEINLLIGQVRTIRGDFDLEHTPIDQLHSRLQYFNETYNKFVRDYSPSSTQELLKAAHSVNQAITITKDVVLSVREMLSISEVLRANEEELSLYFTASISYEELVTKLNAIKELYNELSRLYNVSTSQYPLQISKFEVGSWWIKIFGESKVIGSIIKLCENAASYYHRNFTKEGKIQEIPKKVEVIEKLLDLSNILKENGIDETELKENIKQSSITISKQLSVLLKDEPNVKINDKEFYVGKDLDEKLLQERKTLQLTSGESSKSEE